MVLARRLTVPVALAAASVIALAGCTVTPAGEIDDGRISVVTSTNVYAQVAEMIGGDDVTVSAIVTSASQDPHAFEPSARDQLALSRADLVIENGGGYDPFIDALLEAGGVEVPVITAVEFAPDWPAEADDAEQDNAEQDDAEQDNAEHDHTDHGHVEGFNEHVWYDPAIMADVADGIAAELAALRPESAGSFTDRAADFRARVAELMADIDALGATHPGDAVFVTEPAPLRLTDAIGLENLTPPAFSEAVEEGQDVPPAVLLDALSLIQARAVNVVIANSQTGGAETSEVLVTARGAQIPVLEFSETLPDGMPYFDWMRGNLDDLAEAL